MNKANPADLRRVVTHLTDNIGIRLAGSKEELAAAKYLADEFSKYTSKVHIEKFPVNQRSVGKEFYQVLADGKWREFCGSLFSSSPGTNGQWIEGELVYFNAHTGYMNPDLSYLTGKAVVHLGCHIECEDNYRRLMEAKPAFILFADSRYPADIPLADGLFPAYVKKYGALPSVNVAYQEVWSWKKAGAAAVKINVESFSPVSETTVVVAEFPGSDPDPGIIFAGGHHDTQAGTVGADDNAVGCAAVVELAKILSGKPHRHTVKLICFGAEEQLSFGSAAYVRKHRAEIEAKGAFMCNFDSFGSLLGWADFTINGNEKLKKLIREKFNRNDLYFIERNDPMPYTDQFPFAACRVPGMWIFRANCEAGLFYHHRYDNRPDKLDFDEIARYVDSAAEVMEFLADSGEIASYRELPENEFSAISELFEQIYGGF